MFSIFTHSSVQIRIKNNARRFGNKSSNLIELNNLCSTFTDDVIKISVPEIEPIDDALIKKHLNNHAKEWCGLWNNFVTHHQGEMISASEKETLKKLQTLINDCFNKHPFPISSLKKLKKDDLLMVRSTGEEDTVEIANPGGNKSVAAIKNEVKSISAAIGIVVASYFSKKSIKQRLLSGDSIKKEPFLPVLIQKMVGEKLEGEEKENHIVASGVMYANGPITRIDVAPGHGEAIVNGKVPFDTYDTTEEGVVHAEIYSKPLRLIPTEEKNGPGKPLTRKLILKSNPENLQKKPTFTSDIARRISSIGKKIAAHYQMPMDIEFVYEPHTKTLNIVQARPIPTPNKKIKPSAIAPEHWNKIKTNHEIEKIKAVVISPAGSVTKVLTEAKQAIMMDTIEMALKHALERSNLQENIRAVFVTHSSPSTSHEAAQFNAMGIPVFKTDIDAIIQIFNQKNPIIIADTQHQTIVNWTHESKDPILREKELLDAKIITEGLFVSSMNPKKTLLPIIPGNNKKLYATIKEYLNNKNIPFNTKKVYSELNDAISSIEAASFNNTNESSFQALQKMSTIFKKMGGSTAAKKIYSPHKKIFLHAMHSIAEIDHCLKQYSTLQSLAEKDNLQRYLLDLTNKLKALVIDAGEEVLFSDSIKQIAIRHKSDEIKLPVKIIASEKKEYLIEFLKLNKLALHPQTHEQWTHFALFCSQYPTTRKLLAKYIKMCFQFNLQSELINQCFPNIYAAEFKPQHLATRLFNEIEKNVAEFKNFHLNENHQTILSFEKRIHEWSEPTKFEKLFKNVEQDIVPMIKSFDLEKSMSNLSKQALLKQIQFLADVMDKSIKSLKSSQEYDKNQTSILVKRFVQLLKPYHDLMRICMEAIPTELYEKWREKINHDNQYNSKIAMITMITVMFEETSQNDDSKQLNSSGVVSIPSITVGTAASFYRQIVKKRYEVTLEDFFSAFHQNILASTAILGKDCEINLKQLPEPLVLLMNKIETTKDIQRLSIQHHHPMVSIEYNIPLRNHSAKLNIAYDTRNGSFSLNHKYFGENWTNRMNVLAGLSEIEGLFLKAEQEKRAYYNHKCLLLEFEWKFTHDQLSSVLLAINSIIADYSQMTNDAAHSGISHKKLIQNIQKRYLKEESQFTKALLEYQNKISGIYIDLEKFHDHWNKQILELAKVNNLSGIKEIASAISKKDLMKLLLYKDGFGNNALMWACYEGYNEVAEWLLLQDTENLQKEARSADKFDYLDNVNFNLYQSIEALNFKQIKYTFHEYKNIPLHKQIDHKHSTETKLCEKFIEETEKLNLTTLKSFKDSIPDYLFKKLLSSQNATGHTAFMIAIDKGNIELIQWLLKVDVYNASLPVNNEHSIKYQHYETIKEAIEFLQNKNYEKLKLLLQKNDINSIFDGFLRKLIGEHFLNLVTHGDDAHIKLLINLNVIDNLLTYQDHEGNSALHHAIISQHFALFDYLLTLDENHTLKNLKNRKLQHYMDTMYAHLIEKLENKNYAVFESYLSKFPQLVNVVEIQKILGNQLIELVINNNLEKIKYFSTHLPNELFKKMLLHSDPTDSKTLNAILWASYQGHTKIVHFILDQDKEGIQKHIRNADSKNYLDLLSLRLDILSDIKDYKKMKCILNDMKEVPLMIRTRIRLSHQFKELIKNGDIKKIKELKAICPDSFFKTLLNLQDADGNNVLILALHNKYEELLKYLLEFDPEEIMQNKKNKKGYCFKNYAFQQNLIKAANQKEYEKIKAILTEYEEKNHKKFEFIEDSLFPDSFLKIISNHINEHINNDEFDQLKQIHEFNPIDEKTIPFLSKRFIDFAQDGELKKLEAYAQILPPKIFMKALIHQDEKGDFPLSWAAWRGKSNVINYLLEKDDEGLQKNLRNNDKKNYLDELSTFISKLTKAEDYYELKRITVEIKGCTIPFIESALKPKCINYITGNSLTKLKEIQGLFPEVFISILKSMDAGFNNPLTLAAEHGYKEIYDFLLSIDVDKTLQNSINHAGINFEDYYFDTRLLRYLERNDYERIKDTLGKAKKPIKFLETKPRDETFQQMMHKRIIDLDKNGSLYFLNIILQIPEFHDAVIKRLGRKLILLSQHNKFNIIKKWIGVFSPDVIQKLLHIKNDDKDNAILWAAYEGYTNILNLLLTYDKDGTQINIRGKDDKNYMEELQGRIEKLAVNKNYDKIQSILSDVKNLTITKRTENILKNQLIAQFEAENLDNFYKIKALFPNNFQLVMDDIVIEKLCEQFIEFVKNNKLERLQLVINIVSPEVIQKLLMHQDKDGDSAILWSSYLGHNEITKSLLSIDTQNIQANIKSKAGYNYLDNISYYLITQLRKGEYQSINQYLSEYKGIPTDKGFREPANNLEAKLAEVFILKIKNNTKELKHYINALPESLCNKIFINNQNPSTKSPLEFAATKCMDLAKVADFKGFIEFAEIFPEEMIKSILNYKDSSRKTVLQYFMDNKNRDAVNWISVKLKDPASKSSGISTLFRRSPSMSSESGSVNKVTLALSS